MAEEQKKKVTGDLPITSIEELNEAFKGMMRGPASPEAPPQPVPRRAPALVGPQGKML
ncbi:MAG: hypothetical protein GY852_10915 [bacterium]|nr:hypothetical protein [bacterium]